MSKKKAAASTMTLKDFHGGSIPSDLPLPSAPGVIPKITPDRPVYDRVPRGTSIGRPDQRTRPSSSHTTKYFDDKSLFLPHTANIGRNFNEDERKPLDGHSVPRRMVSDDVFRVANSRPEVKSDSVLAGRLSGSTSISRLDQRTRPNSSDTVRYFDDKSVFLPHTANIGRNFNEDERKPLDGHSVPRRMVSDDVFRVANRSLEVKSDSVLTGRHNGWSTSAGPLPGKMNDVSHSVTGTGNGENSVLGTHPNVWTPWTTQPAVSNLVHTSALERVFLGRWQSKLLDPSHMGFDAAKDSEIESRGYEINGHVLTQGDEPHVERGLVAEDGIQGAKRSSREYEKILGLTYSDIKEAKVVANSSTYPNYSDVRPAGHLVQPTAPSEVVGRPKLNLLPRTKPLESVEKPVENDASNLIQRETGYATQKSTNISKPVLSADEISNQPVEHPKLYLKPVAQLLEQSDVNTEKERNAVFGGARPRELVLKERGIDEIEHHKLEQPLDRTVLKPIERVPEYAVQRLVNSPPDLRTKKLDQKDEQSVSDIARSETQRRNWRANDIKTTRQQHQTQEKTRHPSPETWRKPVSQKPESPDGTGLRRLKVASPLELAQAYSEPKSGIGSNFNINRNNQTQQPFSRLVGSTTTPTRRINGY